MDVHTPSTYTRLSPKKFPQNGRRIEHVGRLSIRSSLGVGGEEIVIRTKVSVFFFLLFYFILFFIYFLPYRHILNVYSTKHY